MWIELFLGCGAATARDISIFVATDLHVMSPELIVNEGAAWDEYLSITHKMEDYSVDLFQDMIDSILFEMPDIVLIPGDISKDGERVSHEYVSEELKRLTDVGIKVYVIPGNHDIGYIENGLYYDGDRVYQADSISPEEFVELYSAFGYEGSIRDENSLSYVAEPVDGLVILGIDSHTNRIEAEELDWICEQAKTAKDNGKQVLAMLHHPIMEHYNGQVDSKPNAILQNADSIRPYLIDAGIRTVFSGHFHTTDVAMVYNENHTDSIYDITTGSKISYPMHHRWVSLSEDFRKMTVTTFFTDSIPGHPEVLDAARERTERNINRKMENNGTAFMSSIARKAYLLHCEGNENEANGVSLIDSIPFFAFLFFPDYWYTLNSMLDDYTFFGEIDQNRVNDLRFTIDLSHGAIEETESLHAIMVEEERKDRYNLMGQKVNENAGLLTAKWQEDIPKQ